MAVDSPVNGAGARVPWRMIGWGAAFALLLIPLAGDWPWSLSDFVFAAVLFALVGGALELAAWRSSSWSYRAAVAIAAGCALLHVWITAAVGIIGSEDNPGNLVYLAVVGFAIFGSVLTLGRPSAMAWVMGSTAVVEVLVPIITFAGLAEPKGDVLQPEVFGLGMVFAAMWLESTALFRKAARERTLT